MTFECLEQRVLLAGLVSHWKADNTASDAVGSNHGSLIGGTTYATGQIGQAFQFDGIDGRVQLADSPSLRITNSLTIEGWVRVDSFPVTGHGLILFRGDDRGGLDPYQLTTQPGGGLTFAVSSLSATTSLNVPIPLGHFVHVAATLEDATGKMRIFMNGVLMSEVVTTVRPFGDLDSASNPGVGIGNHGGYPTTPHNFPFHGLIDELSVYDIALNPDEVAAHFNAGRGNLQPRISIDDTRIIEGDTSVRYQGNLVSALEGGLSNPYSMVIGPDGKLYVSTKINAVLRYDLVTGASLPATGKSGAEFVSPGAGGLDSPRQIHFGPDNNLYVVSENTDSVLRYDGATGEPLGALIANGVGGLSRPRGLLFDGRYVYVTSVGSPGQTGTGVDSILRFDALTGVPAGLSGEDGDAVFIQSGAGGLDNPSELVLHNGSFYVSSTSPGTSNSVLRFGLDGAFLGAFVPTGSGGLSGPVDLEFRDGYLYVTSWQNNKVLRYNESTGAFVDEVVPPSGGLGRPINLAFDPAGNILVSSGNTNEIRRYGKGALAVLSIQLNGPWPDPIAVRYATNESSAIFGSDYESAAGLVQFSPGQISKTIVVTTFDDSVVEPTEVFNVVLSNAVGATVERALAAVTIIDNDPPPTKFYVVNDGSADRNFEYSDFGAEVENYSLISGNSAPRGAASTAAGDKVWVVDANRKVYVYNTSGGLLGSWTAGSLSSSAVIEGITTHGTDVWIVDAKSDKVFKYAGAATRLSGNQTAASSFSLSSGNSSPKDIVTDGVSLWVVNNSTTDKVFKYTVGGTLLGSWTVSTSGAASPTGITLDPANPNHLWIVDNGTNRVYQYDAAATRVSGSQAASTSFALAATNTNPQGIADPPAAGTVLTSRPMLDVGNVESTDGPVPFEVLICSAGIRTSTTSVISARPVAAAKYKSLDLAKSEWSTPFRHRFPRYSGETCQFAFGVTGPADETREYQMCVDALIAANDFADYVRN